MSDDTLRHQAIRGALLEHAPDSGLDALTDAVVEACDAHPAELIPAESLALTVGLAQVLRGEEATTNVATVCILALARLAGRHDWTTEPGPEVEF